MIKTDVLVIGGGISGLHTAYHLQKRGINYIVVEARERLGGRILSRNYPNANLDTENEYDDCKAAYDLGPSWFWPGQKHMQSLLHELGLQDSVFPQQSSGEAVYEDQLGKIQKGFYGISMQGTYRMRGGIRQFIDKLAENITHQNIKASTPVSAIEYQDNQLVTSLINNSEADNQHYQISSNKVVIALPPRIALSTIEFTPALTEPRINELNSYATWMAGHAKLIIIYDKPFWLEQGLSGDAVSHLGPLREIHDASNHPDNRGFALFGFVSVPATYRKDKKAEIIKSAVEQLIRLFGEQAASPVDIELQDWAQEPFTATEVDRIVSSRHATSSISNCTEASFDNRLIWSGTETANHRQGHNGLLEGALEASIRSLSLLT